MVFQKVLEGLLGFPAYLEHLFSKNFTLCLMNQACKEDRFLHRAAVKALKAIESAVSIEPFALVPILKSLLGKNGAYNFDQRTSTKTMERLLQNITKDNEKEVLKIIRRPVPSLAGMENSQAASLLRVYIDYLSKYLNASPSTPNEESKDSAFALALQELTQLAYSHPKEIPDELLTEQIKELCRSRLESSFAKLTRKADDFTHFCTAVSSIDPNSVAMTEEIKTAVEEAMSRMQKLLKRKTKGADEKSLAQGLAMLHAVSIFQLYNEDPDAMEVLNDLAQFSERLKKGKNAGKEEGSSELLVEILLSMVARPSSLMRQVSQQAFEAFTPQISAEGLELLTGPLGSNESTKGQKELFNTEDHDDMEIDDDEDDSGDDNDDDELDLEIDSDVEFVDLDDEEGSEDDADEEEESGSKQEPQDLNELVGKILRSHGLEKDAEAESSDSDGDMSDSEMLALDDKLTAVLKHQVKKGPDSKKQKKDAKQSVVNFKHRILDLLDIYVKNETTNPLTFGLLLPLLNLMRTTSTKPLASRACEIILNYQRALKKARGIKDEAETSSSSSPDDLVGLLLEIHSEAGKDNAHAYAKAASAASLIVASSLFAADKSKIKDIAAVYAKTQSDWVLGEAKLQNSFFADWNNWCQNQAALA